VRTIALNIFSNLSRYASARGEDYLTEAFVPVIRLLLKRQPATAQDHSTWGLGVSQGGHVARAYSLIRSMGL